MRFLAKSVAAWLVLLAAMTDRKSTRLNSSHLVISYAVFCLKKQDDELIKLGGYEILVHVSKQAGQRGLPVRAPVGLIRVSRCSVRGCRSTMDGVLPWTLQAG